MTKKNLEKAGGESFAEGFPEFEIFAPGNHTSMDGAEISFSEEVCQQIASAYDPTLFEAPITVGHPKLNEPAFGWITALRYDGKIHAAPKQVEAQFAEMVRDGRFKKVSASFYTPESAANPLGQGKGYYLRHVGFLGAAAPALKGLRPISFAEEQAGVIALDLGDVANFSAHGQGMMGKLLRGIREWILGKWNKEEADKAIPPMALERLDEALKMEEMHEIAAASMSEQQEEGMDKGKDREKELQERESALAAKEAAFAEQEKKVSERAQELRRKELAAFIDGVAKEGRILAAHKAALVSFAEGLTENVDVVSFSEGDKQIKTSQLGFFQKFLKELPKIVSFGEAALGESRQDLTDATEQDIGKIEQQIRETVFAEKQAGRACTVARALTIIRQKGESH